MPKSLSNTRVNQLTAALSIGADRTTAAHYLSLSPEDLEQLIADDEDLARQVRQAEASAELTHMRNLYQAAEGEKNWRASTWWLESRNPDKYARKPSSVTTSDLRAFTDQICTEILGSVPAEDRDKIIAKFDQILAQIENG